MGDDLQGQSHILCAATRVLTETVQRARQAHHHTQWTLMDQSKKPKTKCEDALFCKYIAPCDEGKQE